MRRKADKNSKFHQIAVRKANIAFDKGHDIKGTQISKTDPKHAKFRKEWMDLYIKYGGVIEGNQTSLKDVIAEPKDKKGEKKIVIPNLTLSDKFSVPAAPPLGKFFIPVPPSIRHSSTYPVYHEIEQRLHVLGITLEDYIYVDPKMGTTLKIKQTTLDGIEFVAKNKSKLGTDRSIIGNHALKAALDNAKNSNGLRAFAGQVRQNDLNNALLQASFGASSGVGFREIFYLPDQTDPAKDLNNRIFLDDDNNFFDLKFGKLIDSPDITSLHIGTTGGTTSIHLDDEGFIFADDNGIIFLSSNAGSHTLNELLLKTILFGGNNSVSSFVKNNITTFLHTNQNSLSDPTLGSVINNPYSPVRMILGLEVSHTINKIQLFGRVGLDLELNRSNLNLSKKGLSGVLGLRISHDLL